MNKKERDAIESRIAELAKDIDTVDKQQVVLNERKLVLSGATFALKDLLQGINGKNKNPA